MTKSAKNLWIGVALLTLVALAVRIPGLRQSLFGDELFTYDTAAVGSLHDLFHAIRTTEVSPPLFFAVEWLVRKVSDAQVWLRLPSLVCGVALIPVVYAVGRRLVGPASALVGAGLAALSPLPYLSPLVGALLVALPRPVAAAGVALAAVGLGIGLAKSFEQRHHRPDWKGVAAYLDRHVVNGDRVVELELFPMPSAPGRQPVTLRALQVQLAPSVRSVSVPGGDPRRLAAAAAGHRVLWVADQQVGGLEPAPPPPPIGGGVRVGRTAGVRRAGGDRGVSV